MQVDINNINFTLISDNNVFSNTKLDEGSRILLKVLSSQKLNGTLLDLGCGYGVIGIYLKYIFKDLNITMVDVNQLCVELASLNINRLNLDIDCYLSDSYSNIKNSFDVVVFNPPISVGKKKIFEMYLDTFNHLNEKGHFFIVIRKNKGALSHKEYLSSLFSDVSVIYKEKGYFIILAKKEM